MPTRLILLPASGLVLGYLDGRGSNGDANYGSTKTGPVGTLSEPRGP